MTTIWQQNDGAWQRLAPVGFPDEAALHGLVEDAPQLLPLAGGPDLTVLGREVLLGSGYADLIAVEPSGRLVVIEVKLAYNSEARRAVVAQILAYAAVLRGLSVDALESEVLAKHLVKRKVTSLFEALEESGQSVDVDERTFREGVAASLNSGAFRLVLVLDQAPAELVRLVGYLEAMTDGLVIDLVTVSAYEVDGSRIMVPQRVDPGRDAAEPAHRVASTSANAASYYEPDGGEDFERTTAQLAADQQAKLAPLIAWAKTLEQDGLARVYSFHSTKSATLLPRLPGQDVGPFTIWDAGRVSAFRSVLETHAPRTLEKLDERLDKPVSMGTSVSPLDDAMLALMRAAYAEAAGRLPVEADR